jgi:hypothetical protein
MTVIKNLGRHNRRLVCGHRLGHLLGHLIGHLLLLPLLFFQTLLDRG